MDNQNFMILLVKPMKSMPESASDNPVRAPMPAISYFDVLGL